MSATAGPSPRYAEVAVNAGQPARRPFTYAVPDGLELVPGQAVFVPFGPRVLQGIVLRLTDRAEVEAVRPITSIADPAPVLDTPRIALAEWLAANYLAPLWECIALTLPEGYGQKPVTMVSAVDIPPLLPITRREQRVLQFLGEHGQVTLEALREAVPGVTLPSLQRLQESGYLTVTQGLARPTVRPRTERRLTLAATPEAAAARAAELLGRTPRSVEARLLTTLTAESDISLATARELGANPRHIHNLESGGWLRAYESQVVRDPLAAHAFDERPPLVLTAEQRAAADRTWEAGGTHLLHGVTGSGKTEVYLDLVRRTLEEGKSAIVLVPEIALTPQAIQRYGERFGGTLAVFHSALGAGERYDQWYMVARGEARLVIGSRSAIFAPARNLGLVVIDEEHEWTYKQTDHVPRYHAREAAAELCRLTGATLVLGSATPDIVTHHRSVTGEVTRTALPLRVVPDGRGGTRPGALPEISLVDMRDELAAGNRSIFSRPLEAAIHAALAAGEQAILFVNRRGSARFLLCRDCGYLPICPACQVAMSLDLSDEIDARVVCNSCGRSHRLEERCPRCDGVRYRPFGVGTQRVEALARQAFRGARILRWDSDTARAKGSHERLAAAAHAGEVDILVGTQMLAKGLDLPGMTVVGVVDADVGLSLPDYHAHERAFQLMSQVAGRAGRRDAPGRAFIQTYNPESAPMQFAALHDYEGFYQHEIAHRRRAGYPPFSRIVRLVHSTAAYEHGLRDASRVADEMRMRRDVAGRAEPDVLGPTPAFIARFRGRYRWQILVRGRDPVSLVESARLGEGWTIDVDPASLL
ncbi:MAG TPA: primosomal protein N' [Tepidiformaceae bacterium]|nr:primosomal protein N' [Tepidiformaceae bacterium]